MCLSISETDARNGMMMNCISVDKSFDKDDQRLGKYVILNAKFHCIGRQGMDFLSFDHVTGMRLLASPAGK